MANGLARVVHPLAAMVIRARATVAVPDSIKGVIHTNDVYDAQRALFENRRVELKHIEQVLTLIEKLGETAAKMAEAGEKPFVFNLCNVSVTGTNLFCAEARASRGWRCR